MPVLPMLSVSLVIDAEQRISYASPSSSELYGEVAVGVPVDVLLGPAWLSEHDEQPILEHLARSGRWSGRTWHHTPHGLVPVAVEARLQADNGAHPIGLHLEVRPVDPEAVQPLEQRPEQTRYHMSLDRLERLQAISARLVSVASMREIAEVVCGEAIDGVGAFAAAMSLVSADGEHLEILSSCGYAADDVPRWSCVPVAAQLPAAVAARTGEPVWVESLADGAARFDELDEELPGGSLCVLPLRLDGSILGTLGFSFAQPRSFERDDRNFLLTIAGQCAHALGRVMRAAPGGGPAAPQRESVLVLETTDLAAVSSRARRLLGQVLDADVPARLKTDLNIVVSELATNASVHAGGPIRITIERSAGGYLVRVDDTSRRPLQKRSPVVGEGGGRGLPIVEALSQRWGVDVLPWGKSVWAELG